MSEREIQDLRQDLRDLIAEEKEVKAELNQLSEPGNKEQFKRRSFLLEKLKDLFVTRETKQYELETILLKQQPTLF